MTHPLQYSKPPVATTLLAHLGAFNEIAIPDLFEDNAQIL
jgi:hypothetical protein